MNTTCAPLTGRAWDHPSWTPQELTSLKDGRTVSVVLPALNEEATVAHVVASIMPLVGTLVDEIIVVDSGSIDNTIEQARAVGATVYTREEALPGIEPIQGKGEVLWRSLNIASGDIVAFVDSDLIDPDPMFVPKLVGPMLIDDDLKLVKAYYRRPYMGINEVHSAGGGRVTELVARPLLAALRPPLSHIIQPLGGEYAGTREHLSSIPFAPGYGVEIGILIDTFDMHGLHAIGQVNLGVRAHRNRPLHELGAMSRQVVNTLLLRCGVSDSGAPLVQFHESMGSFVSHFTEISSQDRPPICDLIRVGECYYLDVSAFEESA